jgi:3-mercaptopyruvate sulfurtransferase SseA
MAATCSDGQRLAVDLGAAGITGDVQVCYDDAGGMYAARAWMLLRWLGHDAVAVLMVAFRPGNSRSHPGNRQETPYAAPLSGQCQPG